MMMEMWVKISLAILNNECDSVHMIKDCQMLNTVEPVVGDSCV